MAFPIAAAGGYAAASQVGAQVARAIGVIIKNRKTLSAAISAGGMAYAGAKRAKQFVGSIKRQKTDAAVQHETKNPASSALTQYHDIEQVYYKNKKRRRVPKKLLKRRKRFRKAVKKVFSKPQPLHFLTTRGATLKGINPYSAAWSTTPNQISCTTNSGSMDFILWPCQYYNNTIVTVDLLEIPKTLVKLQTRMNATDIAVSTDEGNVSSLQSIYIKHSYLTICIHENNGVTQNVDVYLFVAARDIPKGDPYYSPQAAWAQCLGDAKAMVSTTAPSSNDLGNTPLDAPGFAKHWKILSKSRITLGPSQNVSFPIKGPKGMYRFGKIEGLEAQKGKTMAVIIVAGSENAFGASTVANPIVMAWSKRYHWKFPVNEIGFTSGIRYANSIAY